MGFILKKRVRLDELMVKNNLADNLAMATALIMSGKVILPDIGKSPTPGLLVKFDTNICIKQGPRFVSRGGDKLLHAIDYFNILIQGLVCLDVGASTGGFTDCLLQMGASKIYSIDSGRGQLHSRLLIEHKVISKEKTNAHYPFSLDERVDFTVVDVSFISVKSIIPNIFGHLNPNGKILVLYKPQFELKKKEIPVGGVIRDSNLISIGIGRFINWCVEENISFKGITSSPIRGRSGNKEIFVLLDLDK